MGGWVGQIWFYRSIWLSLELSLDSESKFEPSVAKNTCVHLCGGGGWWCKVILVLSFGLTQAEQKFDFTWNQLKQMPTVTVSYVQATLVQEYHSCYV